MLRDALRYAAALLAELRTGSLAPPKYYELYVKVCDEMANLEVGGVTCMQPGSLFSALQLCSGRGEPRDMSELRDSLIASEVACA